MRRKVYLPSNVLRKNNELLPIDTSFNSEASLLGIPSIFPDTGGIKEFFPKEYELKFEQFNYDGPVPGNLDAIRNEKSVSFIRGLASALIETGLSYMEKNRGKLS